MIEQDVAVVAVDGDRIVHTGSEERRGVRTGARCAGDVHRRGLSPLGFQGRHDLEPRQPGGLGFFRQGRRGEEALRRRDPAGPPVLPEECRDARAEERAVLAVDVHAGAGREREPGRQIDVVLDENARSVVGVGESRHVAWVERVPLVGQACNPRLAARRTSRGDLGERRVVPISFEDVTESMILALPGRRGAGGDHIPVLPQRLHCSADVYRRVSSVSW